MYRFCIKKIRMRFALSLIVTLSIMPECECEKSFSLDGAIRSALENNPDIQVQGYAVASMRGQLRSTTGATDVSVGLASSYGQNVTPYDYSPTLQAAGYSYDGIETDTAKLSVWAQKLFDFGLRGTLSFSYENSTTDYLDDGSTSPAYESLGYPYTYHYGGFDLNFSLPILKSFRNSLVKKDIELSRIFLERQECELNERIAGTVLSVSDAYWEYVLQSLRYEESLRSNDRIGERRASLSKRVDAGLATRNEMIEFDANGIKNGADVLLLKLSVQNARSALMRLIGEELDYSSALVPLDVFPDDFKPGTSLTAEGLRAMFPVELALRSRLDLKVLEEQLLSAQAQLDIARVNSLPDVSTDLAIGYRGVARGDSMSDALGSVSENVRGLSVTGTLSIPFVPSNNYGKGKVDSAMAQLNQAKVLVEAKRRDVAAELECTILALLNYRAALENAHESMLMYGTLISGEQRRFDAGLITVDSLYEMEEKYLGAKNLYYGTYKSYLFTILRLKYCSGTLVALSDGDGGSFGMERIYAISE